MHKFLFFTIIFLLILGHIFSVKEYDQEDSLVNKVELEDVYFDEKYKEYGPIEIIESPDVLGDSDIMYIRSEKDCIFFDKDGIPWLDDCPALTVE